MAHKYQDLDDLTNCPDCGTELENTNVFWCGEWENINFCPKCDVGEVDDLENEYPVTQQAEGGSELAHLNQVCNELHISL